MLFAKKKHSIPHVPYTGVPFLSRFIKTLSLSDNGHTFEVFPMSISLSLLSCIQF